MSHAPVDMTPLDPFCDPERAERLIRRIMARARTELEHRAAPPSPILLLAGWARPTLAVAAGLAAVAVGVLSLPERSALEPPRAGVPEELGLPTLVADWLSEGREPTAEDLMVALEREMP